MDPAEHLAHDITHGAFLTGADHGRWRLIALTGTTAIVAVSAEARPGAPAEYALRLLCEGYPTSPPLGVFWDAEAGTELADERWPRLAETVADQAFRRDWRGASSTGPRSLYIITDAQTYAAKATTWLPKHQLEVWRPEVGIACYLEVVYDRLHSARYLGDYRPPSSPAA